MNFDKHLSNTTVYGEIILFLDTRIKDYIMEWRPTYTRVHIILVISATMSTMSVSLIENGSHGLPKEKVLYNIYLICM